jgi:hypothetical protein
MSGGGQLPLFGAAWRYVLLVCSSSVMVLFPRSEDGRFVNKPGSSHRDRISAGSKLREKMKRSQLREYKC